ncbi:MAG: hypothetical protein IJE51_01040 [Clostridia bacterium]|nr:hypothetical protein [Clostridia bacterium]
MKLPWLPIYDVIVALLIIVPLGLIFFSSAFLYNKLCDGELLTSDESKVCLPIKSKRDFLLLFVVGMIVAGIFYLLITHDNFDVSLILIVPPLVVAILCELKNGFVPLVSDVLVGACVLCRVLYYSFAPGIDYGLSIVFGFLLAFAVIFIPEFIFNRKSGKSTEILSIIAVSLLASYFSLLYLLIFVVLICIIQILGYEIPNLISLKHRGVPIFTFRIPILLIASAVFTVMLLI